MAAVKSFLYPKRSGSVLLISIIFLFICSALAISTGALCNTNVQIAENHRKANHARACAESGFEIVRLWIGNTSISGKTSNQQRFSEWATSFQSVVPAMSNVTLIYDGNSLTIPSTTLDSAQGESFSAVITQADADTVQVDVTGVCGPITRTLRVNYGFGTRAHSVFDFGVASKGALSLSGNVELEGANVSIESNAYIESSDSLLALSIIGSSHIAGDVSIVNPLAFVDLQGGQAGIGGETGQAAVDDHVTFGAPPTEFPEPDPSSFEPYVANVVDANTDTSADATFENVRILAGTNPTFSGHVTLKGVVFIETPNVVTFTGTSDVTGIIVGNGDHTDNSGTNRIVFQGSVSSTPVTELPEEEQFAEIRDKTGTFVIAPGFDLSFGGNFTTLSGAIAGNGIQFYGNAGGTIDGSIINYSDEEMALSGNSDLYFNRSGTTSIPAGFVSNIVLQYDPSSYSEVRL